MFVDLVISSLVKGMYGWGNMPVQSIVLFTESMADKTGLDEPARQRVIVLPSSGNHALSW